MKRFWGWELATYLFLGGLGGGMLTFAMVLDLIVYPGAATSSILVWGVFIALIVLAVGTGLLVFELGQPKVFYRAFVTRTAVIKWGAVLLSIAMIFAVLFILWEITWFSMLPFIPYEGLADFFLVIAGIAGFLVGLHRHHDRLPEGSSLLGDACPARAVHGFRSVHGRCSAEPVRRRLPAADGVAADSVQHHRGR